MSIQSKYWKSMGVPVESAEDLRQAGKAIPFSEALKAHRTYDLYHEYGLFNIEFADEALEESYKDQLLCSCVPSFTLLDSRHNQLMLTSQRKRLRL